MANDDEDRSPVVIGVCVFLIIVALVATGLRIYARRLVNLNLWWDDWLCIIGLPFALLSMIFDFVQVKNGFGKHASTLSPETLETYAKYFYLLLLFYNLGLAFFKFSLLAFYIRVFAVMRSIRIASFAIGAMIVAWMLATEFLLIFRCHPVDLAWKGTAEQQATQCISTTTVFTAQAAPTIFFDMLILTLPLRQIWTLQLNIGQKIGVTTVFALGFLVTIISIVRLVEVYSTGSDLTYDYVDLGLWSAAEPVTGLLCCSLVTYGPFVHRFTRWVKGSRPSTNDSSTKRYLGPGTGYQRQRFSDEIQLNNYSNNARCTTGDNENAQKDDAIHVKQEYTIQHT